MTSATSLTPVAYSPLFKLFQEKETVDELNAKITRLEQELREARGNQQNLAQLYEQVNHENETLNEFVASLAHELNNPLQVAASFVNFVLQERAGQLTETGRDYLNAAIAGVKQSQVLLQDLLCEAQLEKRQLEIDLKPVNLREVVGEAVKQFSLMAQIAGMSLQGCNLEGTPLMVLGAANRLQQALINLLINALKFSPEGGRITVTLEETPGACRVVVADEGSGISPENLDLVFQRRFQVKDGAGLHRLGSGLGLSITRDLIELQGGFVGVDSEPGQGSRFWFSLPVFP